MEIKVLETDSPEFKAQSWRDIKALSPDMADWITEVTKVFGKPKSVEVTTL